MIKKRFSVPDMHCTGCTIAVEGAIEDLPGVKSASAYYARQIAEVEYDESQLNETDIVAAVVMAGYSAHSLEAH